MPLLYIMFEGVPELVVGDWARVWNPYANYVVNESTVEANVCCPLLEESCFEQSKEDCGPWWGRGDPHACARDLFPLGVPKCNDVVFKHYMDCFNEGIHIVVVECFTVFQMEVVRDVFNSWSSADVCVHGCCITCKEFSSRRNGEIYKLVF